MTRILIVEDNPLNLQLMETILKANGLDYASAPDGETAVLLAGTEKFDLIMMDLQLPGIDGYEALNQIRTSTTGADLPIVAITGNTTHADQQRARDAGFNGFLKKPFRIDDLLAVIRKELE